MSGSEPCALAVPITLEDHTQGSRDAPITLVQYGDYECPDTRLARYSVQALQREFGDQLRFVFRHFPLADVHRRARSAAAAAEAAATQGEFWAMHECLFEHQPALEDADLRSYATALRLDIDRFDRERSSPGVADHIRRDVSGGVRGGVRATPTFFINNIRYTGAYDVATLRSAVLAARGSRGDDGSRRSEKG